MNEEPGAVFDAHVRAEFVECSVDVTMATMTDTPYVTHVPVLTGGYGRSEVRAFYAAWFVGRSRTSSIARRTRARARARWQRAPTSMTTTLRASRTGSSAGCPSPSRTCRSSPPPAHS